MSENKTPNYGLNLPGYDDFADVGDFNENSVTLDGLLKQIFDSLGTKVTAVSGKQLSTEDFTTALKTKLEGLSNYNDTAIKASITALGNDLTVHIQSLAGTETGVHGLRYYNEKLQFNDGNNWIDIETGGGGGIPPLDIPSKVVLPGNGRLTIVWSDPEDTVIEGTVVARWKGTKLVRKAGSYPASPTDGVLIVDNQSRNAYASTGFLDNGLTNGVTYYYQLFPYTDTNAINQNPTNRMTGVPQAYQIFGVSIDLTNSNPETAVTYTDAAVGKTPGQAWDSQAIFKDIKPCMLKNGVVQYYLNPNNFAQKADGTTADITSGNDGDVMIEIPKTGFAINTSGNTLTIKITDDPANASFKYYAHTRASEGDRSKLYIGAYLGSNLSSKLRSLSGKAPYAGGTAPAGTIGTCRTMAQGNGSGYDQVSFYPLTLLQCLYLIKFKNLNSQAALGRGYVDGNSAAIATGGTNAKGMNFGETTGKQQMKFLGIEDFWGNLRWWIDGLFCNASRQIMTAFQSFNDTGSGYANRGQGATSDIGGYMSKPQGTSEAGFNAKEVSGSTTTYFTDYADLYAGYLPYFGGLWSNGDYAGAFSLLVYYAASSSSAYLGARLMYL